MFLDHNVSFVLSLDNMLLLDTESMLQNSVRNTIRLHCLGMRRKCLPLLCCYMCQPDMQVQLLYLDMLILLDKDCMLLNQQEHIEGTYKVYIAMHVFHAF